MNTTNNRFTISTITVALCVVVALVAAESAQAQATEPSVQRVETVGQRPVPVQRIEIIGKRIPTLHTFVVVGQRQAEPGVQRIVIVGQRQRPERVAAASPRAPAL